VKESEVDRKTRIKKLILSKMNEIDNPFSNDKHTKNNKPNLIEDKLNQYLIEDLNISTCKEQLKKVFNKCMGSHNMTELRKYVSLLALCCVQDNKIKDEIDINIT